MKHPWLSALLFLGLTLVVRSKEAETNHLQEIQHSKGRAGTEIANAVVDAAGQVTNTVSEVVAGTPLADPFSAFLLFIGNILGFFNNIDANSANLGALDLTNIDLNNLGLGTNLGTGLGAGLGTATAVGGGAAALGAAALAALSSFKTGLLTVGVKGLEIANFVLAIIGLALLGAYAYVKEGDITGIFESGTGYAASGYSEDYDYPHDSYSSYVSSARSLLDTPVVQRLATAVHDAITKYHEEEEEEETEA